MNLSSNLQKKLAGLQINKLHNYQQFNKDIHFSFCLTWRFFLMPILSLCQVNKKTKTNKQKQKQKGRSTDLWLTEFSTPQWPPFSKWLRLKWQVAQSFHQACSHDLFWEGVGPPKVDLLQTLPARATGLSTPLRIFRFELIIQQLFTKYKFFMKLPQILHIHKNGNF